MHFHAVPSSADGHVLEVVSSAMSMLDPQGAFVLAIRLLRQSVVRFTKRSGISEISHPVFEADGKWGLATEAAYRFAVRTRLIDRT